MKALERIKANQVWEARTLGVTRTPSRRVLHVGRNRICYSTGKPRTRWCGHRAFCAWIARYKAAIAHRGRVAELALGNSE